GLLRGHRSQGDHRDRHGGRGRQPVTVASSLPPGGGGQGEGAARSGPQPVAVPIEIQEIAVHVVDMPLVRTFRTAHGTTTAKQTLIVRAQDADGVVGWGEAPASDLPLYSPDTLDASWYALTKLLAPLVVGRRFDGTA